MVADVPQCAQVGGVIQQSSAVEANVDGGLLAARVWHFSDVRARHKEGAGEQF